MNFNRDTYLHYVAKLEKKAERIVTWTAFKYFFSALIVGLFAARFLVHDQGSAAVVLVVSCIVAVIFGVSAGESRALEVRSEVQRMRCMLAQLEVLEAIDVGRNR